MDIGSKIKKYRSDQGLTQLQLAAKSNISRSYLGDVEKNRYNPSIETLQKISAALGIPISQLLTVEEKLEMTTSSINKIQEMTQNGLNYKSNESNESNESLNTSPFSQFENEEFTLTEQEEINNFIKYVLSKRK